MAKAKQGTTRVFTEEHKKELSRTAQQRVPTANFRGKHHTEEARAKMSAATRGKPWSEARRAAQRRKKEVL